MHTRKRYNAKQKFKEFSLRCEPGPLIRYTASIEEFLRINVGELQLALQTYVCVRYKNDFF